jgi:hypothetical protein
MNEDMVDTVWNSSWEKKTKNGCLNNHFEVQQFLGFCNDYWWFNPKYSENVELLTTLTKRDEPFIWESEQQLACETLITTFTCAPAH